MSLRKLGRRSFLAKTGLALGAAGLAQALPEGILRLLGKRGLWLPAAYASTICFDPVPDPLAAGWTKDTAGNQNATPGTPLIVTDGSTAGGAFCNFFCSDSALFAGEILLTPRLSVDAGFNPDTSDNNTGIHVSINDGTKLIRAVLLKNGPDQVRVALVTNSGYSAGFAFPGAVADFTLRRLADGRAALGVSGQPEEFREVGQLPPSNRPGSQTLEFGTSDVPASSTTRWTTLGLPSVIDFPAGVTVRDLRLRDVDTNDSVRLRGEFTLAADSDGIDLATEMVSLDLSTPLGAFYAIDLPPGSFELRRDRPPRRWSLSDAARTSTGIERFDVSEDGPINFVDRRTILQTQSYASVQVDLKIGNDSGDATVALIERPPGSGRWVNDS